MLFHRLRFWTEEIWTKIIKFIKFLPLNLQIVIALYSNFQGGRRVSVKFLNAEIVLRSTQTEKQYYFAMQDCQLLFRSCLNVRTTDAQWSLFLSKSQTFGLGQTIWSGKFWGIWPIYHHSVSLLSIFSIIQPLFLKTKLSVYIHIPNISLRLGVEFGQQRIRDLALVCP